MTATRLSTRPFTPLEASLERLEQAVSPFVGIVTGLARTLHHPDECRLPHVAGRVASTTRTLGAATVAYAGSWHPRPERARAAAVGEAIERYAAAHIPTEELALATTAELGALAVPPERFALFHPEQLRLPGFPFVPFTDATRLHFVEGFALSDSRPSLLPAQLVFLRPPHPEEPRIGWLTSNGLACGPTLEEAVLAALLELVERDAVMLAWNNRLPLPRLDWTGDPMLEPLDASFFAPTGLDYSVLDGSPFLEVPVAIGVVHGPEGGRSALAIGAGCAPDVREAWLKALAEAFGVYRWLESHASATAAVDELPPEDVLTFDDHMLFYASHERARLAAFLDASPVRRHVADVRPLEGATPGALIDAVLARLGARGLEAFAADVTSPDVGSLGLVVARAVVPELCALDVAHCARYLGGPRMYSAPYEAGLMSAPSTYSEINPLPHPFP